MTGDTRLDRETLWVMDVQMIEALLRSSVSASDTLLIN
jgi:hypothetical protein